MKILKYFNETFSIDAYTSEGASEIKEWDMSEMTTYEFFISLSILKNNNFNLF